MIQNLTFGKVLTTVGGIISSSAFSIILIIIFLIAGYLLISNRNSLKKYHKYIIIGSILILLLVLFFYNKGILLGLDYIVNHIFSVIYFPNLMAYCVGLLILNIIVWKFFLDKNENTKLRIVSLIVYLVITYLSILLVMVIANSKLDVLSLDDVYQNVNALSLIRLSSIIFIIYLLFVMLYKIYLYYLNRRTLIIPEYNKNEYVVKERVLPTNIEEVAYPKQAFRVDKEFNIKEEEKRGLEKLEKNLTLDDYKLLVQMLVEHKESEEAKEEIRIVPEVKSMLEKVEPVVKTPTIEQVMPVYQTYKTVTTKERIVEDDSKYYHARKNVVEEPVEASMLMKDKVEQLLRLYNE